MTMHPAPYTPQKNNKGDIVFGLSLLRECWWIFKFEWAAWCISLSIHFFATALSYSIQWPSRSPVLVPVYVICTHSCKTAASLCIISCPSRRSSTVLQDIAFSYKPSQWVTAPLSHEWLSLAFQSLLVTGCTNKLNILTIVRSAKTAFMCFVFVWEQTATWAVKNWLVFITEMENLYSAVRTGSLNEAVCLRLCHLQHKLIGFYTRDEKCLQRGTDWVFKWSGLRLCHLQHKLIGF
jgi:hypothetical protein